MKPKNSFLNVIRWVARITGTLLVVFTLIVGIGIIIDAAKNAVTPSAPLVKIEFLFLGIALLGLLMALWKEGLGGFISLFCLLIMFILSILVPQSDKVGLLITVLVYAAPSLLYIFYWWKNKTKPFHKN